VSYQQGFFVGSLTSKPLAARQATSESMAAAAAEQSLAGSRSAGRVAAAGTLAAALAGPIDRQVAASTADRRVLAQGKLNLEVARWSVAVGQVGPEQIGHGSVAQSSTVSVAMAVKFHKQHTEVGRLARSAR